MRLLAVIPARLGASRLPRKPLRLLGGRPLVVRVWQRAIELGLGDHCIVATDAPEICEVVRAAGGDAVLTRADHPSGTDRVAEVVASPAGRGYDCVVNIQGDEPFASGEAITAATTLVTSGAFALGTVAVPAAPHILAEPDAVKVVVANDGRAMYFSRAAIPSLREPADDTERALRDAAVRRHVGIYAYTRDALAAWVALPPHPLERVERLEQLRPLAHGIPMGVATIDELPLPGIDTEADLARAEAAWPAWYAHRTEPPAPARRTSRAEPSPD